MLLQAFDFITNNDMIYTIQMIVLIIISILLYKKCQKKVFERPRPILGFWKKYWYDMKCTYLVIVFAVPSVFLGVEFIKWIKT